jgi:acyl-CoA reductase-like NAD-dependent aldehyde dehydrogenase
MAQEAKPAENIEILPERHLLEQAEWSARAFATYSKQEVEEIVEAVGAMAAEKARYYADWAVRETGYGVIADKEYKNLGASAGLVEYYRSHDFTGYEIDHERKIVKFARPAGVVLALVPSTNPIATTYFKILICLKSRNAVIISPHPAAKECCTAVCDDLAEVAVRAGAPRGAIQVVREPSVPLVGALMQSDMVSVVLATGGPAMVRAAYSSGNPALGVGPGNVASYVDATADIKKAAERIVRGASYDNNLACTCDSVVLADREIGDELADAMIKCGTHAIVDESEQAKLRDFLFPKGIYNPEAIGKSAEWIARETGIRVKTGTKVLGVEIAKIDYAEVFSREKMFPVVGFLKVDGLTGALRAAKAMIRMGGSGHSASIHSKNPDAIVAWGASLQVYRVSVNGVAPFTSSGYESGLPPTVTIGTGYFGRSSVGENVGPDHLVHWTHLAYNEDPSEVMGDIDVSLEHWNARRGSRSTPEIRHVQPKPADQGNVISIGNDDVNSMVRTEIKNVIREIVLEELRDALKS